MKSNLFQKSALCLTFAILCSIATAYAQKGVSPIEFKGKIDSEEDIPTTITLYQKGKTTRVETDTSGTYYLKGTFDYLHPFFLDFEADGYITKSIAFNLEDIDTTFPGVYRPVETLDIKMQQENPTKGPERIEVARFYWEAHALKLDIAFVKSQKRVLEYNDANPDTLIFNTYENGGVKERFTIENGQIEGEAVEYHPNGEVKTVLNYSSGKLNGEYTESDSKGEITVIAEYKDNNLVEGNRYIHNDEGKLVNFVPLKIYNYTRE